MCYKYYGPQSIHGNQPDVEKVHFPSTRWSSHMHLFAICFVTATCDQVHVHCQLPSESYTRTCLT